MVQLLIAVFALILSIIAFLFFILSNYDKLSKHYVTWRNHPTVTVGLSLGEEPFTEETTIPFTHLQPYDDDLMFGVAIRNSSDFEIEVDLEIGVNRLTKTPAEYYGATDQIGVPFNVNQSLDSPSRIYEFNPFTIPPGSYRRSINFILELDPDDVNVHVMRSSFVELKASISADVSQFTIPFTNRNFPKNIGKAEFTPAEATYEILGPHHEDVDLSDLVDRMEEDTREIEIEHPHGYLLDEEDKVVARFGDWNPGVHKVSLAVTDVEYVDGPAAHDKEVHPDYRPNPPDPFEEQ